MVKELQTIPLFPLGVVIVPGMPLPLHIFEDRYKLMISECLAQNQPFGIVLFDGKYMRTVGCTARVVEVIKYYSDGRMDILTNGERRFVVQKVINEKSYLEAHVNYFDDIDKPNPDELQHSIEDIRDFLNELHEMDQSPLSFKSVSRLSPQELSFVIASLEGFTPAERQKFIEMTSTAERLDRGARALSKLVQRSRLTIEITGIIGGNGSPPQELVKRLATDDNAGE